MSEPENSKAGRESGWRRLLHLLLFAMVLEICALMFAFAATVQICFLLFTGEPHPGLGNFGKHLGGYVREIIVFLTGDGEPTPYPLGAWPTENPGESAEREEKT